VATTKKKNGMPKVGNVGPKTAPDATKKAHHMGAPSGAQGEGKGILHKTFTSPPKHYGDVSGKS
jgi:hypothetical protein